MLCKFEKYVVLGHLPMNISRIKMFSLDHGATATWTSTRYRRSSLVLGWAIEILCNGEVKIPGTRVNHAIYKSTKWCQKNYTSIQEIKKSWAFFFIRLLKPLLELAERKEICQPKIRAFLWTVIITSRKKIVLLLLMAIKKDFVFCLKRF